MHYSFTVLDRLAALPPPDDIPFGDVGGVLILRGQTDSEFQRAALREEFLELIPQTGEDYVWDLAEGAPLEWLQAVVMPVDDYDKYPAFVVSEVLRQRTQKFQ